LGFFSYLNVHRRKWEDAMSNKIRWAYDITGPSARKQVQMALKMNEKNRRCESERTHPSTSESRRALKFEDLPGFNIKIGGYLPGCDLGLPIPVASGKEEFRLLGWRLMKEQPAFTDLHQRVARQDAYYYWEHGNISHCPLGRCIQLGEGGGNIKIIKKILNSITSHWSSVDWGYGNLKPSTETHKVEWM
jgi:hypothetical protein